LVVYIIYNRSNWQRHLTKRFSFSPPPPAKIFFLLFLGVGKIVHIFKEELGLAAW
jgi:hypothetical protein